MVTKALELLDPKLIEKQNKAFHRMSKKRQRLAIAKDVMLQLRNKRYLATPGRYHESEVIEKIIMDLYDAAKLPNESQVVQENLLKDTVQCEVCGLGAAFCSLSRLGNKVSWDDKDHEVLRPIFGDAQVALIEYAFEGRDITGNAYALCTPEQTRAAERFCDKRPDDDKRLAAIFRNIVKNDGIFKP